MNLLLLHPEDFISENRAQIAGRRLRQLREVIRAEPGKQCKAGLLNGETGTAEVLRIDGDMADLSVTLNSQPPAKLPVTLIAALPRPKTLRKVLHVAASMGAPRLIFIECWKVDKSYWSSPMLTPEAIREELLLALEQAGDTVLPEVEFRRRFRPFAEDELPELLRDRLALAAHPYAANAFPTASEIKERAQSAVLLIGPEGGFTDYEIDTLEAAGASAVHMGRRILRTEFALAALLGRFTEAAKLG